MSYVLDALKRANAERERHSGAVPGLAAQTTAFAPRARRAQWLRWALLAVLNVVVLGLLGLLLWRWTAAVPATTTATAPTPPVSVLPAATPAASSAAQSLAAKAQATAAKPPTATVIASSSKAKPTPASASAPTPSTASASAPSSRTPTLNELPESLRGALPKLVVNAALYSGNATERLLIINGQPQHEGDTLAPELLLERIDAQSAVLRFRGTAFSLTF